MRYLRRFVHLMQPDIKHEGLSLPTELTATPYRGWLAVSRYGALLGADPRPGSRLTCGN
jgi:hypothetical protein